MPSPRAAARLTPAQIKGLRKALGETTAIFGARFARGARAVEDWEQGRRVPDALVQHLMAALLPTRQKSTRGRK